MKWCSNLLLFWLLSIHFAWVVLIDWFCKCSFVYITLYACSNCLFYHTHRKMYEKYAPKLHIFNKINIKVLRFSYFICGESSKIAKIDRQNPDIRHIEKGEWVRGSNSGKGNISWYLLVFSNEIKNFWREWVVEMAMIWLSF